MYLKRVYRKIENADDRRVAIQGESLDPRIVRRNNGYPINLA